MGELQLNFNEGMDQQFLEAFSEVIKEEITRKNEVNVPGLGVFKPAHRKQFQQQYDNGRVVMMPPEDQIKFIPDSTFEYDRKQ